MANSERNIEQLISFKCERKMKVKKLSKSNQLKISGICSKIEFSNSLFVCSADVGELQRDTITDPFWGYRYTCNFRSAWRLWETSVVAATHWGETIHRRLLASQTRCVSIQRITSQTATKNLQIKPSAGQNTCQLTDFCGGRVDCQCCMPLLNIHHPTNLSEFHFCFIDEK